MLITCKNMDLCKMLLLNESKTCYNIDYAAHFNNGEFLQIRQNLSYGNAENIGSAGVATATKD